MKRLIVLFLLIVTYAASAQDKKHLLKLNMGSLVVKNIALQYEHGVGKRTSVAVGVRLKPLGLLPFQQYLRDRINDPDLNIGNIKEANFALTPEFRYYFKQSLKGFYIAPYARYAMYGINAPVLYHSALTEKTAFFTGDIHSFSGGILLGSQFSIGKNWMLDFWILGGHFGASTGNLDFTASLTPQEQDEIRQTLSNADIPLFDIEYTINANGGTITSKGAWLGFRGLALNLAYRF